MNRPRGSWRRSLRTPTRVRPVLGLAVGLLVTLAASLASLPFQDQPSRAAPALFLVLPGLVAALIGGRVVALAVAAVSAVVFEWGFLPPVGSFRLALPEDVVAAVVFVVVAVGAGTVVAAAVGDVRRLAVQSARNDALQEVDRQRAALLRSVSHDLRTPLTAIRAVASDLRSDAIYDETTRAELLGFVVDESDRLDRIVTNLLSLSRIEVGALVPDRSAVDLAELFEACLSRHQRLVRDVRLIIDVADDLPFVDADYTQLDQVVTNLLENAARHSPAGGVVCVRARATGEVVVVDVEDEGPGVAAEVRGRLFEPFVTSGRADSTGVGLAICKAIVEVHGGTIRCDERAGGGTTFSFTVPALPR